MGLSLVKLAPTLTASRAKPEGIDNQSRTINRIHPDIIVRMGGKLKFIKFLLKAISS